MSASPAPAAAEPDAPSAAIIRASDAAVSYWSVVGAQLRKNRVAMAAWAVVQGMVVVAMIAPLISMNVPILAHGSEGTTAPLLFTLFDRFVYGGGVDVFFNLLLLVVPCWTIGGWIGQRYGGRRSGGDPEVAEARLPRGDGRGLRPALLIVSWWASATLGLAAGLVVAGLVIWIWSPVRNLRPATLVIAAWTGALASSLVSSAVSPALGITAGLLVTVGLARLRSPVIPLVVWLAYLAFGVVAGARLVGLVLLMLGVPGALLLLWSRSRGPAHRAHAARAARVALAVLFVGTFAWLMGPGRDTSPLIDYTRKAQADRDGGTGWALFPPVRFHPDNIGETGQAPAARSLRKPGDENVLGCDLNGRDVASRLVFGSRFSLTIGLVAVAILVTIGIFLGSLAGYYQGKVDLIIMRLVEVMICFPTLFLLLTIVAIFDSRSIFLIMGAIGLVGWPGVTRLVRAEFLRQRGLDYVTAARSQGIPQRRIIFGHVLPNCMGPVLVSATFGIASAILTESGLAFLGLGDTSAPSWGQMLNSGRNEGQWHLILAPGAAIFLVVTVFNLLGEGVRDALDPKLRR